MKNEMSRRQFLGFAGSAAAVLGLGLVGCGGSAGSGSSASGDAAEVYFLQFKPEVDKEWKEIAKAYKKEKGVEVKIVTAASNTYEEKLKSEMSKSSAPTLFQVNGPTGLKTTAPPVLRTGRITAPTCPIPSSAVSSLTTPWLCSPTARIWVSTGSRRATASSTTSSCSRRLVTRPRTSTPSTS